jgi:hypothetical protein
MLEKKLFFPYFILSQPCDNMQASEYVNCKFEVSNLTVNDDSSFDSTNSSSNSSSSCSFRTHTDSDDSRGSFTTQLSSASSTCSSCRICSNDFQLKKHASRSKDNELKELKTELNNMIINLKTDLNLNFSQLNYEQALLNAKLSTIQCYLKVSDLAFFPAPVLKY